MDEEIKTRLFGKLDKMSDDIVEIKVTLGKQEESLAHHIKRTDLLEARVVVNSGELSKSKGVKDFLVLSAKIGSFLIAAGAGVIALVKRFS